MFEDMSTTSGTFEVFGIKPNSTPSTVSLSLLKLKEFI